MRYLGLLGLILTNVTVYSQDYPVEVVVQSGHTDDIHILDFSADGKFMLTGSKDKTVKLWDLQSGREIRTFQGNIYNIVGANIGPENKDIITAAKRTGGTKVRRFNIFTGAERAGIKEGGLWETVWDISSMAVSRNGVIATAGDNLKINLYKANRKTIGEISSDWNPQTLEFSPNGNHLAAGGQRDFTKIGRDGKYIYTWDVNSQIEEDTILISGDQCWKIIYSSDGRRLASLSSLPDSLQKYNNYISIYDLDRGNSIYEENILAGEIKTFAYSNDGRFIGYPLASNDRIQIAILDILGENKPRIIETVEEEIFSMDFSPNDEYLVVNGKHIQMIRVRDWRIVRTIKSPSRVHQLRMTNKDSVLTNMKHTGGNNYYYELNLSNLDFEGFETPFDLTYQLPDQSKIAVDGNKLWKINGKIDAEKKLLLSTDFKDGISGLVFSSKHNKIAVYGYESNDIALINNRAPYLPITLEAHKKGVRILEFSPEGNYLVSGSADRKIMVWDPESGVLLKELVRHNNAVNSLLFTQGGTHMYSSSKNGDLRLWNMINLTYEKTLYGHSSAVNCLAINHDGSMIASGSGYISGTVVGGKSEIVLWNSKKNKRIRSFSANTGYINQLFFLENSHYLISTGNDPLVMFSNPTTGNQKLNYYPYGENDYIIYADDMYYTSTKSGISNVHFVKGLDIFSFENFDLKYNRPDIVLERLGYSDPTLVTALRKAYKRRIAKLGFDEDMLGDDFHLPKIHIANKSGLPLLTNESSLNLQFQALDTKYIIKHISVKVNGVPYQNPEFYFGNEQKSYLGNISIPLSNGSNYIQISCFNSQGVESFKDVIEIECEAPLPLPDLYVVVLGVTNYKDSRYNLTYPVKDGRDVIEFFGKQKDLYSTIHVDSLFDDQCVIDNLAQIKDKLTKAKIRDQLILFLAGHGVMDENFEFYYGTYNMDFANFAQNGMSYDDIDNFLEGLPMRNKLLLMDACHSGEIDTKEIYELESTFLDGISEKKRGIVTKSQSKKLRNNLLNIYGISNSSVELIEHMFNDMTNASGTVVIAAAAGDSFAFENDDWNNGVFTYSFLEGLKEKSADIDNDGHVDIMEIQNYVIERVYTLTNGEQKPTVRKGNLSAKFILN